MICFSLWFWVPCAFYNRPLKKPIILLSKCTSRLVYKRIHIKLVSSVNSINVRTAIKKQMTKAHIMYKLRWYGCTLFWICWRMIIILHMFLKHFQHVMVTGKKITMGTATTHWLYIQNGECILKFDFQKREKLRFSEANYLNCTKKTQFCMWQLHFP